MRVTSQRRAMRKLRSVFLLLLMSSAFASAATYNLFNLVPGGQLVIGDKTFTFISATLSGTGNVSPAPPLSADDNIELTPEIFGNLYGFNLSGNLVAAAAPGGFSTIDLALVYTVSTVDNRMTDLHNGFNGTCVASGNASCTISINETVTDENGVSLLPPLTSGTSYPVANPPLQNPVSGIFATPQNFLRITKDINLTVLGGTTGAAVIASVSVVDQFVSQVPEPGFYGLLASGLSALVWFRFRRKTQGSF
jgi:hypothetical protein